MTNLINDVRYIGVARVSIRQILIPGLCKKILGQIEMIIFKFIDVPYYS